MEPINKVNSVITPLDRKNVDTDQIISKEFLKRIERTGFRTVSYFITGALMKKAMKIQTLY